MVNRNLRCVKHSREIATCHFIPTACPALGRIRFDVLGCYLNGRLTLFSMAIVKIEGFDEKADQQKDAVPIPHPGLRGCMETRPAEDTESLWQASRGNSHF